MEPKERRGMGAVITNHHLIAALAALFIIGGAFAFCSQVRQSTTRLMRRSFEEAKASGELPPELENLDFDSIRSGEVGFGTELSDSWKLQIWIADMLAGLWYIWIPLVLFASFGTGHLIGRHP